MKKAVLDTNVLVSSLIKRGGIPDQILRKADQFELVLSKEILQETYRVLHYSRIFKKYHLTEQSILEHTDYLRNLATVVINIPDVHVVQDDPDDDMIIACALAEKTDYIVSGDPHLKELGAYKGIQIVAPSVFLGKL